uniref:C2H2-type domain-containing protein n=1 Tax=Chrysemys picta bellii TaxID=8478 RepID=A0A8C3FT00_CHRPI
MGTEKSLAPRASSRVPRTAWQTLLSAMPEPSSSMSYKVSALATNSSSTTQLSTPYCFCVISNLMEAGKSPSKSPVRRKRRRSQRLLSRAAVPLEFYRCDICKKDIKHLSNFQEHQRIHTGERPYHCETCQKNFIRCADLIKHRLVHSDNRPHCCDACGKHFKLAGDLAKHSKVHSDEAPFKCDVCAKRFKRTSCLIKHLRIHTEEKPFKCSQCSKRFKWECHAS